MDPLLPPHGGYRHLISFQVAQLTYDVTVRFCHKYIGTRSRTNDQMVQAARSGVQNIAEASLASATSRKTEIKLTNVARASLGELRLDYEDYLRQRTLPIWQWNDPRRTDLINRRPASADAIAQWARDVKAGRCPKHNPAGPAPSSPPPTYPEIAANGALALIAVACSLLKRQLDAQAEAFQQEGGFTERLYRHRRQHRDAPQPPEQDQPDE